MKTPCGSASPVKLPLIVRFVVAAGSVSVFVVRAKMLMRLRFWWVTATSSFTVSSESPHDRLNRNCGSLPLMRRIGETFPSAVRLYTVTRSAMSLPTDQISLWRGSMMT